MGSATRMSVLVLIAGNAGNRISFFARGLPRLACSYQLEIQFVTHCQKILGQCAYAHVSVTTEDLINRWSPHL